MNLQNFVKVNFLAGLFGSLVFTPLAYVYELITVGPGSPLLKFELAELGMLIFFPLLTAVAFAVAALMAFPIVSQLERRGIVSFTTNRSGQ